MSTTHPSFAAATTVDELCEHLSRLPRPDSGPLCAFARAFFAKVPGALLEERSTADLAAMTVGAWEFLQRARPQGVTVELTDPADEGWQAPVTVLRAQVGDRPFIVDTIREYLNASNIPILHYVYPVVRLERDGSGRVTAVNGEAGSAEALTHCEIPQVARPERREEIRAEVERRLHDVVDATRDFGVMQERVDRAAETMSGYAARFPDQAAEYAEYAEFLRWLKDGNFVFLGARSYDFQGAGDEMVIRVEPGSGLGILVHEEQSSFASGARLGDLAEDFRVRVTNGPALVVSKANRESTVHRAARMDYVGVRKLDDSGRIVGEWRFLGLFTSQAYAQSPSEIPILRRKLEHVLATSGARPGSHDYKEIISIVGSMPKDELFGATAEQLQDAVDTVLQQLFKDEVAVTVRPEPGRAEAAVMVILPRGRYSAEIRRWVGELVALRSGGTLRSHQVAFSSGDQARMHFYLSEVTERGDAAALERTLEREIASLLRSWEDRLEEALASVVEPAEARRLAVLYGTALGDEYKAVFSPEAAVADVQQMEAMRARGESVAVDIRAPSPGEPAPAGSSTLRLYLSDERLVLSDFMPILEDTGVRVLEMDSFDLAAGEGLPQFRIYSFTVQTRTGQPIPAERAGALAECLLASRGGDAPRDPFNALVLAAGLRWRQADVLRTYANYASQIGAVPSRLAPVRALTGYPQVAAMLVQLFEARFDPARTDREEAQERIHRELLRELEAVTSLVDDRALRRMMNLIEGTMRTNYFRGGGADPTARSGGVPYVSIKVRNADVEELRKSRLLYEIYVHSSRMEGVHLRGAPVSRGGIRWSDRPDDFRTEILGLVQTQIVKNATIVPSGSKGGFITKRQFADRDQQMAEAADQYRTLIRGLLDVTDNLVEGKLVPPPEVVRYDGDDPYLVVAADKGTAHLSDVANAVAEERGFWLGDAFASGGSHGYDHKKEGITARGGWECVKRHFRETGKDIQTTPFTVAGIGDMSGDVFGNGMLLSEQIRLVAAFDHRHIFIDPDPDPAVSFAERKRMFELPRSSWEDYDRSRLSPGAMIVPRASKEIEITPEARRALGLADDVERLDGEGLVRAVLTAPVELLWNGGIGTYVKDEEETHADAGDTTNDPVRVDAQQLRCRVLGEGGNLGLTQLARIAFARMGGRLNTDALDNSAGVDMSDHEVNLKILLNRVVESGQMTVDGRNELLASMTDEVSRLVLRNNIGQSLAVSLDRTRSSEALDDFTPLLSQLDRDRRLDREAEGIPLPEEMAHVAGRQEGLPRPTLCVLLAHAKLFAKAALLASDVPDDPAAEAYLVGYFPAAAVEAAGMERVRGHRLRREIVTTELVNDLVNLMGSGFLHRTVRDTGAPLAEVVRAWLVASRIAGAAEIRADLAELESRYPVERVYRWVGGLARVLDATTRWLLATAPQGRAASALVEETRDGLAALRGSFARFVAGEDKALFMERLGELQDLGVDRTMGERLITLRFLPQLLEILAAAREAGTEPLATAAAFYAVSERLGTARLREALQGAAGSGAWERRHAQALSDDVAASQRRLVAAVLARGGTPAAALAALEAERAPELRALGELMAELRSSDAPLAGYALAVRLLAEVAGS